MKVNRAELLTVLSLLKPGLADKEIVEQACHFLFTGEEVATFNDQICIIHPYKSDLVFSVKGEEFYRILSSSDENDVEITLTENTVNISTPNMKAGMSKIVGENNLIDRRINIVKDDFSEWKDLPEEFSTAAFMCMFSASKDLARGALVGVCFRGKDVFSSDGKRISHYRMKDAIDDELLIMADDVAELIKFPIKRYSFTDNWAHFHTDDDISFSCKVIKTAFPNAMPHFNVKGYSLELPNELKTAVDAVTVFADGTTTRDKSITITVESGKIICKASKEGNWIDKSVDVKYNGEPFSFKVTPSFLSQVLSKTTKMTVEGKAKALFTCDKFRHVLLLITTEKAKSE